MKSRIQFHLISPDNFIFYIFNNFKKWDLFNYKYECEPLLDSDIKDISIKYLEYFENSLEMNLDSYIQKSNDYKIKRMQPFLLYW